MADPLFAVGGIYVAVAELLINRLALAIDTRLPLLALGVILR